MSANTALEALTVELLGDIGVVHNEVKALRQELPETTKSLAIQTEILLSAAEKLLNILNTMMAQVQSSISDNTKAASSKAVEAAKVDIRNAAADAAKVAVGDEIRKVVGTLKDAEIYIKKSKRLGIAFAMMLIASSLGATIMFVVLDFIYLK